MKEHGVRIVVEGKDFRLTVHNATMDWKGDLFLAMEEGQPMTLEQWAHMVPASIKEGYLALRAVMYPDEEDCFYTLENLAQKEGS